MCSFHACLLMHVTLWHVSYSLYNYMVINSWPSTFTTSLFSCRSGTRWQLVLQRWAPQTLVSFTPGPTHHTSAAGARKAVLPQLCCQRMWHLAHSQCAIPLCATFGVEFSACTATPCACHH
jgi:hypothetical protein